MMVCPVCSPLRITQHFGQNPDLYEKFGIDGHNGVDFTGEKSGGQVDIFAPYDGKITEKRVDTKYGKMVRLITPFHDGKRRDLPFGHLSVAHVSKGQSISLGDK